MSWFYAIYKSEYCKEEWNTLMYDWTFEQFLELDNHVKMMLDLEKAQKADQEAEEIRQQQHQQAMQRAGF